MSAFFQCLTILGHLTSRSVFLEVDFVINLVVFVFLSLKLPSIDVLHLLNQYKLAMVLVLQATYKFQLVSCDDPLSLAPLHEKVSLLNGLSLIYFPFFSTSISFLPLIYGLRRAYKCLLGLGDKFDSRSFDIKDFLRWSLLDLFLRNSCRLNIIFAMQKKGKPLIVFPILQHTQ